MTEVTQHTHSVCEWIIQVSSDTENWRTELRARLAVSLLRKLFSQVITSHTLVPSYLSSISIAFFFLAFMYFFFSSALFPHARSLYSCTVILLEASNVVSFQEMALFFPIFFFHEHCQFILPTSFLSYHHLFDFTFPSWF